MIRSSTNAAGLVRAGPHQTPLSGRYDSKAEAQAVGQERSASARPSTELTS
jgi:hypothetical protein